MTSTATSHPPVPDSDPLAKLLAEVSLCGVTLALTWGFARLFTSASFLPRLFSVAVVAHVAAALARRCRLSFWITTPLLAVVGVLVLSWIHLRHSLTWGLPGATTLSEIRQMTADAFSPFRRLVAPVEVNRGFELTMGVGVWVLAVFADGAAFSGQAPTQAIVPHLAVFVGSSVFARHRGDVAAATALSGTAMVYFAAYRALGASGRRWVQSERRRGASSLFRVGALISVGAVAAAALMAPRIPGATSKGWVDLRSLGQGPGPVEVGNPLIGVGNLLGAQSDELLFSVDAEAPHYWRLTSLEEYEPASQQWRTRRSYHQVESDTRLPTEGSLPASRSERAVIELTKLQGIWLPAPFRPTSVKTEIELRYDPGTSSVIAGGRDTLPAATYEVTAEIPETTGEHATGIGARRVESRYIENPQVAASVDELTQAITAGKTTEFDQMRALQDYFRSEFVYDAGVDYSQSADPTAAFLAAKSGFCQQFASTFAVMARLLAIPSRVAVGFTYGDEVDPVRSGLRRFDVRGRQAHAWPEVYLRGAGWVPFEPTPGRGNPDAEQLTGVQPAQDDGPEQPAEPAATTTAVPAVPTTSSATPQPQEPDRATPHSASTDQGSASNFIRVLAGILGSVVAALGGRILWVRYRRHRRRGGGDPSGRVRGAWLDACEWLELARIRRMAQETPTEFSARASRIIGLDELAELARLETMRLFGDEPLDDIDAEAAERAATSVGTKLLTQTDRRARVFHLLGFTRRN
ncbi:MAG: transglutaminase domain-containing protein [Microthrixaceae bacterium]|nr:transglutaminase domain-containing protein [Microthrixaceae bacterium]